jgi:hypothetical protein
VEGCYWVGCVWTCENILASFFVPWPGPATQ